MDVNQYGKYIDSCQCEVVVTRRVAEGQKSSQATRAPEASEGRVAASTLEACRPLTAQMMSEDVAIEVASLFHALSDPVRLRIFSMIATEGEACSCNLEDPVAKSQPTVSHHTRILADAGLIVGEKRGRWTYWRVVPERLELVANLLRA